MNSKPVAICEGVGGAGAGNGRRQLIGGVQTSGLGERVAAVSLVELRSGSPRLTHTSTAPRTGRISAETMGRIPAITLENRGPAMARPESTCVGAPRCRKTVA